MNKEKQIKEMVEEIMPIREYILERGLVIGERSAGFTLSERIAKHLIENKNYRKASDVAIEILKEVRQALLNMVLKNAIGENYDIENHFAEIEKKYTEDEG